MNLAWALKRLSVMNGREVRYRLKQSAATRLARLGIGVARPSEPSIALGTSWVADLPRQFDPAPYRRAAEEILAGRFNVFAMRGCELGFPPEWNRDPKTGVRAPLSFGKTLNYRDESLVGDIKYLWEPNRHLELVTLAQTWHLTGEQRFAAGCRDLLNSWFEQCPYPLGPHWTSSLEHGVRLLNWAFAWRLLGGESSALFEGEEGARFKSRWLQSIYQQCHFIAGHLSRFSSANNHILGELTGLYVACSVWPYWRECAGWKESSRAELEHEALLQNFADGVNREQATWYHHEVADMMLIAGLFNRSDAVQFQAPYWNRLEAMLDFIAGLMNVAGAVPMIGDSDDAVMVRLSPVPDFNVYRSLLATGALLFGRSDFKSKAGAFDDKSRWLLGDAAAVQLGALPVSAGDAVARKPSFPQGGYFVLGDELGGPNEVLIVADVAPLGYLAIAAHGHADALSFVISCFGEEVFSDPGTFAYHTQRKWRDYFRGTSAHNTIRIDGLDQSVAGGSFLWTRHANAKLLRFDSGAEADHLAGEHYGYQRLADPVSVQRQWAYHKRKRRLTVTDTLECKASHQIETFWHFAAHCQVTLDEGSAIVQAKGVRVTLTWPKGLSARLVRGQEDPPLGWESRSFDLKTPAPCVVVAGSIAGSWQGVTEISIERL